MRTGPFPAVLARLRLLAVLAGLAWLLGITPAVPVRLLLLVMGAMVLAVDVLSDAARPTGPARAPGRDTRGGAR
ncbi:hypothetical protein LO771_24280 [Streptacidiphilus sp. ASG 303]|uniref:hypothetical protein n=1 Tax=Streptacidiphilus sp. ASG 303 TaxID=2896847 RepID=UPI001E63A6CE|nr:hypothetical protein [Streptacidiphilus sp. ASG 303]MCD0485417.1 hypothetical protein [Streptacidiphilus sp. ASG 303]